MAKSSSFFGMRKGSTKAFTFSVLKGTQVTKDRVTDVANPRTLDQTTQRIPFAQAVKFYKFANKNLFKFAYEDKKQKESDYNAFMRHNVALAASVSKANYENNNYPSLGNYLLSKGSLVVPECVVSNTGLGLYIAAAETSVSTIAGVSALILEKYPQLVEGDIVTFVAVDTELKADGTLQGQIQPTMVIKQFVIDTNSTTSLSSLGFSNVSEDSEELPLTISDDNTTALAGAVIFSRQTPNGLKVSTSALKGGTIWNSLIAGASLPSAEKANAYSWGAVDKAILQGAVADQNAQD